MAKSLCVAYLCWLFGGIFGLHHLYLRRTIQCFLWLSTGGVFGVGLLRDLFRMPEYVADCNEDSDYMEKLKIDRKRGRPPFSFARFIGQIFFGLWFRNLVYGAIPDNFPAVETCALLLPPIGTAIGIYLVGNVGRQKGDLLPPLVVALAFELVFGQEGIAFWAAVVASGVFAWRRKHREKYKSQSFCRRLLLVCVGAVVLTTLVGSYLYFNCEIETEDGEKIKLRDAIVNMLNSPAWREFADAMGILFQRLRHHGFADTFRTFIDLADVEGEQRSLEILGLEKGATEAQAKRAYKKLVVRYHPDKNKEEGAAERFMEIQKAYETLGKIFRSRREREEQGPGERERGPRGKYEHEEF